MKRKIILAAFVSLFLAAAMNAQSLKTNFAGEWELDTVKSTLPERMQVDSMTMKVSQTDKELTIESVSKRAKSDAPVGGMRGGGMRGGGTQNTVYNLEGKEMTEDIGSGVMSGKETRKATATADGKLNLNLVRAFTGEMGGVTMKTNEVWELLDAGNTLKVMRYMETPRGAVNAEMCFIKKSSNTLTVQGDSVVPVMGNSGETPNQINGGVLNGKTTSLPKPAYPAAARAVKASGAVNVQVTIDEQGNVISASAISGHPLLRQAAENAAREAKFSPTILQGNPVKVTGIIVYNFVP